MTNRCIHNYALIGIWRSRCVHNITLKCSHLKEKRRKNEVMNNAISQRVWVVQRGELRDETRNYENKENISSGQHKIRQMIIKIGFGNCCEMQTYFYLHYTVEYNIL